MLLHALPPLHCLLAALLHGLWAGPNCSCQHHKARQWQHSFRLPQIPPEAPLPVFPHHLHHSTALPTCTPSSYPIVQHIELQLKASAPDPFLAQSAVCFRAKGALCMPKILPAFFFFPLHYVSWSNKTLALLSNHASLSRLFRTTLPPVNRTSCTDNSCISPFIRIA